MNVHTLLLDVSWLLEGLLPRTAPMSRFPSRLKEFLSPKWPVHSRDDLISIGEAKSALAVTWNALSALAKGAVTGQQPGELLLDNANYNPVTTDAYRARRTAKIVLKKVA